MSIQPRRIRLKPWLLTQVNSARYPGLQWLGSEQRLFQIPWKHATRHTPTSDEDNTIFKAWAQETGKYQEGVDEPDPAKWKANLRCALNKSREFQLKYDGTKETPVQPYKIYEVIEPLGNADCAAADDDEEMPNLMDLSINPRISGPSFSAFPPRSEVDPFGLSSSGTFGPHHVIPVPLLPVTSDLQAQGQMVDQGNFVHTAGLPNRLQDLNSLPSVASVPPEPDLMEASSMGGIQNQGDPQNHQPCKYDLLSSVPLTDLDLKFQYRGRITGSLTVSNPQGCRLYYGHLEPTPEQVDLFGPVTLQQVLFPGTSELQNQKQRFYTNALLDVMDRGLILEIWEQDIYAIRLCQCKVFWSGPGIPEQGPPNPMEREKKIRVFSLNDFLQGLILFHKGEAPNPPPFEIYFCFGEDWPDKKPKEKKLIIVQVVPVVARILTEMFSGELSWSTDSIRLQISNPDVKDQTVEQFKELQRLLQSQQIQGPWTPNVS
ncbi:Interferon regulatory factor 5 [Scophthalmus maximus]|uniref:Interferon regulatory factor 5 n=1 Tax=Scophthalmus maximus TaxID=52904 RepID=A0A2U9B341_SCOMX|nr:interferon regulatory factor 5 [Scophthalmus maximus]XP_047192048.1 interferon regulatory factor 5-like [Scophthalmus maximus]AWO98364.1 Interferon regulatory factor 5 [Scophthalmus maximus]